MTNERGIGIRLCLPSQKLTTVGELKLMIEKITQVPPKYQRLIIECIQINLGDGSLLSACPQIQNNATIRLVQRLEGGSKLGTVDPSIKKCVVCCGR